MRDGDAAEAANAGLECVMKSIRFPLGTLLAILILCPAGAAGAADPTNSEVSSLTWSKGPGVIDLHGGAIFSLPDGYLFLDGPGTKKLLTEFGNKTSGREIGFITPQSRTWFVIVEHLDLGYVSDENWRTLDTSALLRTLQRTDEQANAEREQKGWPTVAVQDWAVRPRYDPDAHAMEWAVRAESGGKPIVNHTVSLLGRQGVVQFCLIDPSQRSSIVSVFRQLVRECSFKPGERHVDHQPGDRIAKGGLAALVGEMEETGETEVALDAPATVESSGRTVSSWKSAWLAAILGAAVVGFACGRLAGRRGKRRHSRSVEAMRRRVPNRTAGHSPIAKSPPSPATAVVPGDPPKPAAASEEAGGRRSKRYDSYSFYLAMTRDLHWTINY